MRTLSSVDLNLLKVLSSVYRHRNLTKAGEDIGMSQPAVSRAMDRLTHLFGERLFVRINGEMKPTRTTELIIPQITQSLSQLENSLNLPRAFDPASISANCKFGFNDYGLTLIFPKLLDTIREQAPSLNLSAVSTSYSDASCMIHSGEIDCAIVSSLHNSENLVADPVFNEDYVVISGKQYSSESPMDLKTYLEYEHILVSYSGKNVGWVDEKLLDYGTQRTVAASVYSFATVPNILQRSPYLCALPRRLAKHFSNHYALRIHELPFESKKHTFYYVRPKHLVNNAISNWIRDLYLEICNDM
ncbi:LysR family transcriptional regulator [Neptuniibacter sp. QD34_54]|uniref:LysR family transcriptional regulator n=1 Tax=Neptuniibacter sp. QD34_54 TaxID=3398208 RepID=UPI0039F51B8B